MTWASLGSVNLTKQWQTINLPSVNGTLFRLTQTWSEYPVGKGLIRQIYGTEPIQYYGTRVFYPSSDQRLIEMPVPEELLNAGVFVRFLSVKYRSRYANPFGWTIVLEEYQ